jgi:hypothetical protein
MLFAVKVFTDDGSNEPKFCSQKAYVEHLSGCEVKAQIFSFLSVSLCKTEQEEQKFIFFNSHSPFKTIRNHFQD